MKKLVLWFHGAVSGLGSLSQASIFKVTFLDKMAATGIAVTSQSQQQERREKEEEAGPDPVILRRLFESSTQHFHLY